MPPLQGNLRLLWRGNVSIFSESFPIWSEVGTRFAALQNQPSQKILLEDATPAWIIGDVRFGATLFKHCDVRFGVENVLDRFYHEHFAINNVPNRGRNVYVNVSWRF